MRIDLPAKVAFIIQELEKHGYEAYAVGGCVRDTLLHKQPMDWDITTSATPQEVKQVFVRTIDTGIEHGTVTVMLEREGFEVTTYRIDGKYEDGRHPKKVTFTPSLTEDLKRRDFTINAMAYSHKAGLVDLFGGIKDLQNGIIRCVGDAKERFSEDALRMMRAVRFAAQLGFTIEPLTKEAIVTLAPTLNKISAERIQVELVKLITSDHPEEMRTLYETGITKVILPEFDAMMNLEQDNPHHCYTVGEHTIHSMQNIAKDKVLRLTMLLHDVAKPVCMTKDEAGIGHFYGHPAKGKEMANVILRRLKMDNATRNQVLKFVFAHDRNPVLNKKAVRKEMVRIGVDCYPDIFAVKRADILAQSDYRREEKLSYVDDYEAMVGRILEEQECLTMKDLAISGKELKALGVAPGPKMGEILKELFELVLEDPKKNQKEQLISEVKKKI